MVSLYCPGFALTNNAPSQFPIGTNTVTWTVTDASGNAATCTQKVIVRDNQNPTIACPDDVITSTDANQCFATGVNLGSPTVTDNCPGFALTNNAPSQFPIGTNTVTWTVTDASGNTATCAQKVIVRGNQNPTIACPDDVTTNTDPNECFATGVNLGSPTRSEERRVGTESSTRS